MPRMQRPEGENPQDGHQMPETKGQSRIATNVWKPNRHYAL